MKKKIIALFVVMLTIVIGGCAGGDSKDKDVSNENGVVSQEENNEIIVDAKLKDMDGIKKYLSENELFQQAYQEMAGEGPVFDNYKLNYVDFNNDGSLDTIINTWKDESDYRVAIFIALKDGEYQCYVSNVRTSFDTTFSIEDGFIVIEDDNFRRIANLVDITGSPVILSANCSFSEPSESEYIIPYNKKMVIRSVSELNKIDGLNEFEQHNKRYYTDENGKAHLVGHIMYNHKFNKDSFEFESKENIIKEDCLDQVMNENLIIGENNNLKTFDNVLNENKDLRSAIDYYFYNRDEFSKSSRIEYVNKALEYVGSCLNNNYMDFYTDGKEVVVDGCIKNVKILGENPVPEYGRGIFKLAKYFYVEDGKGFAGDMTLEEGDFKLTCVDKNYAIDIRSLKFDKGLLEEGKTDGYLSRDDEFVDVVFENREQVLKEIDDIVYPTISVNKISQINELKKSSLWKAQLIIVPEEVEYVPYDEESCSGGYGDVYENEKLFSEDEEFDIDYNKYGLVVIPEQESVNQDLLSTQEINMTQTGDEISKSFTVIGTLQDVKLTYIINPLDQDVEYIEQAVGKVINSKITINSYLPYDSSCVKVEGKWYSDENKYEEISFTLDTVRDPQSYKIIAKEYQEY